MQTFILNHEQSTLLSEVLQDIPRRSNTDILYYGAKKLSNFTVRNISYYLLIKYGNYKKCFSRLNETQWTYHPDNQGRFSVGYFGTLIRWLFFQTSPEDIKTFSFTRNVTLSGKESIILVNQDGVQLTTEDADLYKRFTFTEASKTHFELLPETETV